MRDNVLIREYNQDFKIGDIFSEPKFLCQI